MSEVNDIDPDRLYSAKEACALIPSRRGCRLHRKTLHRWRAEGRLAMVRVGGGWFVWGGELLRLLQADRRPEFTGRTPAQRKRAAERAMAELKKLWGE